MSLEQLDEEIQAGPVIEIEGELSALQWQAWHVLLAHAYDELADKTLHAISVVALESALGLAGETPDALKEVLRALRFCGGGMAASQRGESAGLGHSVPVDIGRGNRRHLYLRLCAVSAPETLRPGGAVKPPHSFRQTRHPEPSRSRRDAESRQRLEAQESVIAADQKGESRVPVINTLLTEEFCHDRIPPSVAADEGEKVRGLRAKFTLEDTDRVIERLPNAEVIPVKAINAFR